MNVPHICPICDEDTTMTVGFGLAAGGYGQYAYCDNCDNCVEYNSALDDMSEEEAQATIAREAAHMYYHIQLARLNHKKP